MEPKFSFSQNCLTFYSDVHCILISFEDPFFKNAFLSLFAVWLPHKPRGAERQAAAAAEHCVGSYHPVSFPTNSDSSGALQIRIYSYLSLNTTAFSLWSPSGRFQ